MEKESKIEKPEIKEEEMKKTKEISAAERGELPPIFMIYRDNDLFKEYIPKITETLRGLGRKVEIQNFPAGTEWKEMEELVEEHKINFEGKEVVADETVTNLLRERKDLKIRELKWSYLDKLTNETVAETILGDEYEEMLDYNPSGEKSLVYVEKAIPTIVEHILQNKENIPDEVVVSSSLIKSHAPFGYFSENEAKEKVKEWLVKGGIPKEAFKKKEERTEKKRSTIWYILDRHNSGYPRGSSKVKMREWEGKETKEIYLGLPLANFFRDALSSGLLELKPEELQKYDQILKKKLKEEFGEKTEKKK
jgi:hypothetical protein